MNDPFIFGPLRVALAIDDWAAADGAMVTRDDEVVPILDLTPHLIGLEIFVETELKAGPDG